MLGTLSVFDEMERLRRGLDRVLETGGGTWNLPFSRYSFLPGRAARAYPLVNVADDRETFYVEALAPGIDPATLNITVTGQQLTISGSKAALPGEVDVECCHRVERASGEFRRTVELPSDIDRERITAGYRDGLLRISVPKAEAAKPKSIPIQTD